MRQHDNLIEAMKARMARIQVGDALAQGTDIGPVSSGSQLQQDLEYIEIGRKEGATLAAGGERLKLDTEFGLSAGIATTSLKYATHFKRHSQAGMVMVNLPTAGVDYHVPFGGRKGSSYGPREQGRYAQEFFTVVKTAYVQAG
ncbi:Aldehyde dehydrogenase, thermostable (plasmid) [Variovorax sp. PBL-E5]|nr:Aldehyde dehydrogenase, thermostable [Variovorax sp. PBL-E5]